MNKDELEQKEVDNRDAHIKKYNEIIDGLEATIASLQERCERLEGVLKKTKDLIPAQSSVHVYLDQALTETKGGEV